MSRAKSVGRGVIGEHGFEPSAPCRRALCGRERALIRVDNAITAGRDRAARRVGKIAAAAKGSNRDLESRPPDLVDWAKTPHPARTSRRPHRSQLAPRRRSYAPPLLRAAAILLNRAESYTRRLSGRLCRLKITAPCLQRAATSHYCNYRQRIPRKPTQETPRENEPSGRTNTKRPTTRRKSRTSVNAELQTLTATRAAKLRFPPIPIPQS